mgnify:CR=1 FL=1
MLPLLLIMLRTDCSHPLGVASLETLMLHPLYIGRSTGCGRNGPPNLISDLEAELRIFNSENEFERWSVAARQARYNVSAFAHLLHCSLKQLRQEFRIRNWGSPKQFLDYLRAVHASKALTCGQTAKEVAFTFYYYDSPHLHRALKKHLSVAPSELIAQRVISPVLAARAAPFR